jgi:hypothetical protein
LETEISYENIIIFRKIANTLLLKEEKLEKEKKSKQGFFGRLFGVGKDTTPGQVSHSLSISLPSSPSLSLSLSNIILFKHLTISF